MKKSFIIKILFFIFIVSNSSMAGDTNRIIQSNILGAVSSLILPAKASIAISLLPYIRDNKTEDMVLNSMFKNKNKTVVMISHKQSSLRFCDKIYELKNGALIQKVK